MITRTAVFGGAGLSYRIPALCTLPDGTLCAFCEARQGGGDWNTMDLIMRRRTPDGRWLDAQTIAGNPHGPVHNPGPFVVNGELHLLYGMDYERFYQVVSRDGGLTFSEPEDITYVFESFRGRDVPGGIDWRCIAVGPGGVTQLKNGRIVAPVWLGGLDKPRRHDPCQTGSIYSDDGGKTWNAGEIIDIFPLGPSEAQIAPLSDGGALISLRNQGQQHKRGFAWSPDGAHWSKPVLADNVCEVNCQGSLISVGDLMVITGPEPEGDDIQKRERKRLTLRVSRDEGHTWSKALVLVEGTAGYSALALQPDGALMCLYETWEDEDMLRQELLTITPDEFEKL